MKFEDVQMEYILAYVIGIYGNFCYHLTNYDKLFANYFFYKCVMYFQNY